MRQAILDVCRRLYDGGYIFGTWGNVSARLPDGNILMTPSRMEYADMMPEDLPVLTPGGEQVCGERLSTSERELHRGILNARPDVNAVVHTHSPYAMAAAALEVSPAEGLSGGIPVLSEEMCQLLGGAIPITAEFVPSEEHAALGRAVTGALGNASALLIRNHGIICCGRNLREAEVAAQVAEKSAQVYLTLLASGAPFRKVEEPYVTMGRNYFLYGYGKT